MVPANNRHHGCHAQRHANGENIAEQMPIDDGAADHDGDAEQSHVTSSQQPAKAGGEKRRVASRAVVLETFPPTSQRHQALFPLVGEVARGSRWAQEGDHATY